MANAFKQKQEEAKLNKLRSDCAKMADGGAIGRLCAVDAYAKGAGVSKEVAERVLEDFRSAGKMNFKTMFAEN